MQGVSVNEVVFIFGIILVNVASILGFFVSLKVGIARLEVKVDKLERDVQNLGDKIRQTKKEI